MRNFYHSGKFCTLIINFSELWPRQILLLITVFGLRFRNVLKQSQRHLENVLTRTDKLNDTLWTGLEDIFARRFQDVFKMSWKRLEDVLNTFLQDVLKTFWRRLENISARHLEDVLKTSWKRLENVLETSSRCLEDVFARRLEDILKTSWQDVLKTYD